MSSRDTANVLWFDELHREDVNLVGGKSSSLGEMTSSMDVPAHMALRPPPGRISTS